MFNHYTVRLTYAQDIAFLIGILSMQGWTVTKMHEFIREKNTKTLKHTENLFRMKNLMNNL